MKGRIYTMAFDNIVAPKSTKNRQATDSRIRSYFEDKDNQREVKRVQNIFNENSITDKINDVYKNSKAYADLTASNDLTKYRNSVNEAINMTAPFAFASMVFKALPLDEDFKVSNVNYIFECATKYYNTLASQGTLKVTKNSPFERVIESIAVAYSGTPETDKLTLGSTVKNAIHDNDLEVNFAEKTVSDKVISAVGDEKTVSTVSEAMKEAGRFVSADKTLFRYLNESNIHVVLEENPEISKDDAMDLAMCESILQYTLLEMAYTLKLVDLDLTKVNTVKKFINC